MKKSAGNRILMLLENRPYPQDLRVRREADALCAAGYHVTVICPVDKGQPFRETVDGVIVYRYPAPPDANGLLAYVLDTTITIFLRRCIRPGSPVAEIYWSTARSSGWRN